MREMARGVQQLTITVVPGLGTGELVGLAGTKSLQIADGVHAYDLAYTLPGADPRDERTDDGD